MFPYSPSSTQLSCTF